MKKKKAVRWLRIVLPLVIGTFFILYSYHNFTEGERRQFFLNIRQINPFWIVLSVTGGLLSHISRAYRWKLLLRPLGYKTRLSTSFMAVMAGYLANLGIPRSGEVLRAATLSTYENLAFEKVFGTIVVERAIDVLVVFLLLLTGISLHTQELLLFLEQYQINPWLSLLGVLVLIGFGIGVLVLIKNSNLTIFKKTRKFVSGILEGVKSILKIKRKGWFIFHTLFIWGMYVLTFYLLKYAFPAMHYLSFSNMLIAFMAGSFAISITNGGIGIYPIAVGAALALFGLEKEIGEAFGWVDWGIQTLLSILVGGVSLLLLSILKQKYVPSKN